MKKRILNILLIIISILTVISITACGDKETDEVPNNQGSSESTPGNEYENNPGNDTATKPESKPGDTTQNTPGNTPDDTTDNTPDDTTDNTKIDKDEATLGEQLGLTADFFELSWSAISGANKYVIKIGSIEYETKDTTFELFKYISPGETKVIKLKAVGLNVPGSWAAIEYTAESATEGLVYTELIDGTYSAHCPIDKIPENGEIVVPDTYNGIKISIFRSEKQSFGLIPIKESTKSEYDGPEYSAIKKIRLPKKLTSISDGALYKASISKIFIPAYVTLIGNSAFEGCANLKEVTIPNSVKKIGAFAFAECTSLENIAFSTNMTTMGIGAFISTAISKIEIPSSLHSLPFYVFYNCTKLSEIILPESFGEISTGVFDNTAWYNSQPDGIVVLQDILYGYKGEMPENTSIVVPGTVRKLRGRDVFKDQKNLVSITLHGGISSIPRNAFSGCENLKEVILSEGLKSLDSSAFQGCGFESITFPKSLTNLGFADTFRDCVNLTEITIHSGIENLGARCFYGCKNLKKVTIEDGVLDMGTDTFYGCSALTTLTIPDSVTDFDLNSIAYTGITHFVFPKNLEKKLVYTPKYEDGILLTYLIIQKDTKNLDLTEFYIYKNLNTFFYEGTREDFEKIKLSASFESSIIIIGGTTDKAAQEKMLNEWRRGLTVCYYSETEPTEEGDFWHYVDGVPTKW